jgi:hypothetical protein
MEKVWIVTDGDYSDYRIVAVFSTEEQANYFIKYTGKGDAVIEMDVDKPYERKDRVWRIDIALLDHKVIYTGIENSYDNLKDCIKLRRYSRGGVLSLWIEADNLERAVKIANERIGQVLAGAYMFYKNAFLTIGNNTPYVSYKTGEIVESNYNYGWQD